MKILFLSHKFYPEIGGIEINSEILASAFHKAGHDITLMTWTEDHGNKCYPFRVIRNPNIYELLLRHKWADVVFENNPSLRLAWPAFFLNKPFVVALRTWISRIDGKIAWQDKLKTWWLKRASAVIAVSEAVRKKSWPPAIVIGNPYRCELFKLLPDVEKNVEFVFLGRLVSDKGADMAIKSFANLLNVQQGANNLSYNPSLTIIGDGPELPELKQIAINLGIEANVKFMGSLSGEALVRCLNKHRFILVPSRWEEPFGNVALEGMACGCIPIVSNGGGLVDAVGNAGIIFIRGDLASLTEAVIMVLNDPHMETKLRNAAREHLLSHQPEIVSGRYLSVIENAV